MYPPLKGVAACLFCLKKTPFFPNKEAALDKGLCDLPPRPAAALGEGSHVKGSLDRVGEPKKTANHQLAAIRGAEPDHKNT